MRHNHVNVFNLLVIHRKVETPSLDFELLKYSDLLKIKQLMKTRRCMLSACIINHQTQHICQGCLV